MATADDLQTLWTTFAGKLGSFIRIYIQDPDAAADVLQEVFAKIHGRIHTLGDTTKLESWIYQITRHVITDYWREQKKVLALRHAPVVSLSAPEPEDRIMEELAPCVRDLVERLPDKYRQALRLTQYQGLRQKELADHLGISLAAAKSRVQRAREKLKAMLLACCHFEFDRRGLIMDYHPRCRCCADGQSQTAGGGECRS